MRGPPGVSVNAEPLDENFYGYIPSLPAGIIFLLIFTTSTVFHVIQSFRGKYRWKWMYAFIAGGIIEMLGWCARIWSSRDVDNYGFIVQTIALVIAPTLYSAVLYEAFENMIALIHPRPQWIHPRRIKSLFATTDFLSVTVQLVGAGIAARATTAAEGQLQLDIAAYVIAAGILWQLIVMIFFVSAAAVWWRQVKGSKCWKELDGGGEEGATRRLSRMMLGGAICSAGIIIRGCYRVAEFSDGFEGTIGEIEGLLLGLDAVPIAISMLSLNYFHPNILLPLKKKSKKYDYVTAFAHLMAESKERKEKREKKELEKANLKNDSSIQVELRSENEKENKNEQAKDKEVDIETDLQNGVEVVMIEEKVIEV